MLGSFMQRSLSLVSLLLAGTTAASAAAAQAVGSQDTAFAKQHYIKRDHMVPMRDGVRLFTIVYEPRDTTRTYPILLVRTPYSIRPYEPDQYRRVLGPSQDFDREGYIFVFQDVRGKFRSEGEFEVMRPFKATPTTRSTGCSRTFRATTGASACGASRTRAGRRSWG
jgi:predicted acyl esterase